MSSRYEAEKVRSQREIEKRRSGSVLGGVFVIQPIHDANVDRNQHYEYVDAALLSKPEAEFESADSNLVQLIHKQDPASIGNDEPDCHKDAYPFQVGAPIG